MTALALPAGPLSIACLGAHPDDIEIGCGATLLQLAARSGTRIRSLVMTGNDDRRDEATRAATAFGAAAPVFAGLADGRLPDAWGAVKAALHEFAADVGDADVVFAPRPDDLHQDHRLVGELAATVWRGPLVLHYEIPKWDGDLGRPNVYVPADGDTARRKVELLHAAFPSQSGRHWWDDELFFGLLRMRGVECASRYAEAFISPKTTVRI